MLFKAVYNWIKFKTLPPSILFKNRLFLERDSKHRRILTNLGNTYRNSKWSHYVRPNLSLRSSSIFFNIFKNTLILILAAFTFYYFSIYYNYSLVYNPLTSLIWYSTDLFVYTYLYVYLGLIFIYKIILKSLRYVTIFNLKPQGSALKISKVSNKSLPHINAIGQHKAIFYFWLKGGSTAYKFFKNIFAVSQPSKNKFVQTPVIRTFYTTLKSMNVENSPLLNVKLRNDFLLSSESSVTKLLNTTVLGSLNLMYLTKSRVCRRKPFYLNSLTNRYN
jgi:hypothetical protein